MPCLTDMLAPNDTSKAEWHRCVLCLSMVESAYFAREHQEGGAGGRSNFASGPWHACFRTVGVSQMHRYLSREWSINLVR